MNWTTTKVPLWQIDCENFRRADSAFEVPDVTTTEHQEFVEHFAARYGLKYKQADGTVRFERARSAARVRPSA